MLGGPNNCCGHAPPSALFVGGGGGLERVAGGLARISRLAVSEEKRMQTLGSQTLRSTGEKVIAKHHWQMHTRRHACM